MHTEQEIKLAPKAPRNYTWQFLPLILGSSVLTAVLTQCFSYYQEQKSQEIRGRYSALRIASVLEDFEDQAKYEIDQNQQAMLLNDMVVDQEDNDWSDHGRGFVALPKLEAYPPDIDWQSLDLQDASDGLDFPNVVNRMSSTIGKLSRQESASDVELRLHPLCKIASDLAARLRKTYRLPARSQLNPQLMEGDLAPNYTGMSGKKDNNNGRDHSNDCE